MNIRIKFEFSEKPDPERDAEAAERHVGGRDERPQGRGPLHLYPIYQAYRNFAAKRTVARHIFGNHLKKIRGNHLKKMFRKFETYFSDIIDFQNE